MSSETRVVESLGGCGMILSFLSFFPLGVKMLRLVRMKRERAPFQPTCSELVLKIKDDVYDIHTDYGGDLEWFAEAIKSFEDVPKITQEDLVLIAIDEDHLREVLQRIVDFFDIEFVDNIGGGGRFESVMWILYQYVLYKNGLIKEFDPQKIIWEESKKFEEVCYTLDVRAVSDEEHRRILAEIGALDEEEVEEV